MPDVSAEACEELAQFLEKADYSFDMSDAEATPSCGSAGCIGGHAAVLWPEVRGVVNHNPDGEDTFDWNMVALSLKLRISEEEQGALCYLYETDLRFQDITRRGAATTVRHLGQTGVVEWREEEQV